MGGLTLTQWRGWKSSRETLFFSKQVAGGGITVECVVLMFVRRLVQRLVFTVDLLLKQETGREVFFF
jgi:hypothetical protein